MPDLRSGAQKLCFRKSIFSEVNLLSEENRYPFPKSRKKNRVYTQFAVRKRSAEKKMYTVFTKKVSLEHVQKKKKRKRYGRQYRRRFLLRTFL